LKITGKILHWLLKAQRYGVSTAKFFILFLAAF
jgi:hypothetical protein